MEEYHLALAKANLIQARSQYEAAEALYKNILKIQQTGSSYEHQADSTEKTPPRKRLDRGEGFAGLTSHAKSEEGTKRSSGTFCVNCKDSALITYLTQGIWPGGQRPPICNLSEAMENQHNCDLCQFVVDASRLTQASCGPQMTTSIADSIVGDQIRMVHGPDAYPWSEIAECVVNSPFTPFAWMEVGDQSPIGGPSATYICLALDLRPDIRQHQSLHGISGPRLRSQYEQSTGLINCELIKSWMNTCETFHGPSCDGSHDSQGERASRGASHLIDVKSRKIVSAPSGARYIAMSYVWGFDAFSNSNKGHQSRSQIEDAITIDRDGSSRLPEKIPQTLEDALTLTEAIGEQFVWIDRYCINQDNLGEVEVQVAKMDMIYRQAWLTIIPLTSETADSGIAGVSRPMLRRTQPTLDLPQGKLTATYIECLHDYAGTFPWDQRAWTLQEFVLSRRCLVFSDHHVRLKCQEEYFHDVMPVNESVPWIRTGLSTRYWWENMYAVDLEANQWNFMVHDGLIAIFSGRKLRYQSDVLRACQGALNRITQKTGMRFTMGLPVKDLHRALIWKAHNDVLLQRRRWYDEESKSWMSYPSWTWAGWQGRTECDFWVGDMAGYFHQSVDDLIEILNRKGRTKDSQIDSSPHSQPTIREARIMSYPTTNDPKRSQLTILSTVAKCTLRRVRKHDATYYATRNDTRKELVALGDHWTILDPKTGDTVTDVAGNETTFEKRDYFFRADDETSAQVIQRDCQADLLMVHHWPLIRDSGHSRTWLQNMVSCLVVIRDNEDDQQTVTRIAAILLEEETWQRFEPVLKEVVLV